MKKIVKANDLLYIIVEIQLGKDWVEVDAFIDSGGSNNLARPSLFKSSWKPLRNIINSETIGGNVTLTHYVDNIPMKIGGNIIKISAIQYYDQSSSLILGMPFITSVLPMTITKDKIICNIKNKAVCVNRISLAESDVKSRKTNKSYRDHSWAKSLTKRCEP